MVLAGLGKGIIRFLNILLKSDIFFSNCGIIILQRRNRKKCKKKTRSYVRGYLGLVVLIVFLITGGFLLYQGIEAAQSWKIVTAIILWFVSILFLSSLTIVSPNQSKAILFLVNI